MSPSRGAGRSPLSLRGKALALLAQRDHSRAELRRKLLAYLDRRERQERAQALRWHQADTALATDSDAAQENAGPTQVSSPPSGGRSGAAPTADLRDGEAADPAARLSEVDELLDWLQAHRYLDDARFVESRTHARSQRYGTMRIVAELRQLGVNPDEDVRSRLRDTEEARASAVWTKRFGGDPPGDARERARQMRFLAQRGFAPGVIRQVVGRLGVSGDGDGVEDVGVGEDA